MADTDAATQPAGKTPGGASGTLIAVANRTDQPDVFVHHVKDVPDLTKDYVEVSPANLKRVQDVAKANGVTLTTKTTGSE